MNGQKEAYWAHSRALLMRDKGWMKPLLVLGAALVVPIAGLIGVMGYVLEWARLIAWGVDASPKQRNVNVGECMASGWRGFVVVLAYALVASIFNMVITFLFGQNAFTEILTSLLSFAVGIAGSLAALHAAIYQKISAGFSFSKFGEMLKRDGEGFGRAVLVYVLVSLVIGCALGLLYSVALVPVIMRLGYVLEGFDLADLHHLSYSEYLMVTRAVLKTISAEAPLIAVLLYITCVVVSFTMLVQYTTIGLWMRQFDVPAWGSINDPLPGAYPGLPASSVGYGQQAYGAYGQPQQGQPYRQDGYGQQNVQAPYGQAGAYPQQNVQAPYGQAGAYPQQNVQQPYAQGGAAPQQGQYPFQGEYQLPQGAGQTGYASTPSQTMPTIVPVPVPLAGQNQGANAAYPMPSAQADTAEQSIQIRPVQVAQPYVQPDATPEQPKDASACETAEAPTSAFFAQVQSMEQALCGGEQIASADSDSAAVAVQDEAVASAACSATEETVLNEGAQDPDNQVIQQEADQATTSVVVEPVTKSSAIPEPIILPPAPAIAPTSARLDGSARGDQVVQTQPEEAVDEAVDDDPIEVGDIIGARGEQVVEVINLSGTPRPKRVDTETEVSSSEEPLAAETDKDSSDSLPAAEVDTESSDCLPAVENVSDSSDVPEEGAATGESLEEGSGL